MLQVKEVPPANLVPKDLRVQQDRLELQETKALLGNKDLWVLQDLMDRLEI